MMRMRRNGARAGLALALGAALLVPLAGVAQAAVLGPDGFGYTADTSAPTGFEDISGTGTAILANRDDDSFNAPIGFSFPFYGDTFTDTNISSNGLLAFGTPFTNFSNTNFESDPPFQPVIAPYWDDLTTGPVQCAGADQVYFQTLGVAPNRRLVVQWEDVENYFCVPDPITFEVALFENGDIEFRYEDVTTSFLGLSDGRDATIGITGGASAGAPFNGHVLQVSFNQPSVSARQTILFHNTGNPATGNTLSVQIVGPGTVSGLGISCPPDCTEEYFFHPTVTLTGASTSPIMFWDGCDSVNGFSCDVTMNTDRFVRATFGSVPPEEGGIHRANVRVTLHQAIRHGMLWLYGHVGSHRARCRQNVPVDLFRGNGTWVASDRTNAQGDYAFDPFDLRNSNATMTVWAQTDRTRYCQAGNSGPVQVPAFALP